MMTSSRLLFAAFGLAFVVAGGVQFNDPDPLLWVSLYGFAAALSWWALVAALPRYLILVEAVAALVVLVLVVTSGFEFVVTDSEEMREIGGVTLVLIHAALLARLSRSPLELWVDGRQLY